MKELPYITPFQYIFLYDKSLLNIDIKIDDKPDNLTNCERKILFNAWHNNNLTEDELNKLGIERVNNWYEIKEKLIDSINN